VQYSSDYNTLTMRTLRQCLLDLEAVHLRYIERYWDLDLTSKRQPDIAAELAKAMPEEDTIHETWESLPKNERQALDALLTVGGRMPFRIFARKWGEIRRLGPGRMAREKPWDAPDSPAEGLWLKGFISRTFEQGQDGSYEAVFIPQELLIHLPMPEIATPHIDVQPVSAPSVVISAGDKFLDDLCTILAYTQNTPIRAKADGTWHLGHETLLRAQLRDATRERLEMLHHITKQLNWLQTSATDPVRLEAATVTPWLRSSPREQREKVTQAWREDTSWNELLHIRTLKAENRSVWRNDPLSARRAIIHHLAGCTPGAWYTVKAFASSVHKADPDFLRPTGDYDTTTPGTSATLQPMSICPVLRTGTRWKVGLSATLSPARWRGLVLLTSVRKHRQAPCPLSALLRQALCSSEKKPNHPSPEETNWRLMRGFQWTFRHPEGMSVSSWLELPIGSRPETSSTTASPPIHWNGAGGRGFQLREYLTFYNVRRNGQCTEASKPHLPAGTHAVWRRTSTRWSSCDWQVRSS